jgi:hypothetical protein
MGGFISFKAESIFSVVYNTVVLGVFALLYLFILFTMSIGGYFKKLILLSLSFF